MTNRRFDRAELRSVEKTPQGGIKAPAYLTRTGVFSYFNPDGSVRREYRSPDEVFAEAHLKSIAGAPVTLDHPKQLEVTADSWRALAVGHAGETIRRVDNLIEADVYVQDANTVERVLSGERTEISLGYDQVFVAEPGISPEGEAYDGRQTQLICNHIALVPRGRAGRGVGLRLDSAGDQIECATLIPVLITIAGKEYEAGSPEAAKALSDLENRVARADSLASAYERAATEHLRARVRALGIEVRTDADMQSTMLEALKKLAPGVSVEGMSEEWLAGAFAVALAMALELKSEPEPVAESPAPAAEAASEARADMLDARTKTGSEFIVLPRDLEARRKMIERGRTMRVAGEK